MIMKIRTIILLFVLFLKISCYAAGERIIAGARSLAMGGATVVLPDIWSSFNNQAAAAFLDQPGIGIFFENHFFIKELQYEGLAIAWPTKQGTFSAIIHYSGASLFNEIKTGLAYSRKFGKYFSAGIQLDWVRVHVAEEYGNKNLISCEIGLLYRANKQFSLGLHIVNPVPIKLSSLPRELLPTTFCLGTGIQFSPSFLTTLEIEKDLQFPPVFRCGMEYNFARSFNVRVGISTQPVTFSFGFGLEFGNFKLDLASTYHQVLGFSPSGSVIYSFK